MKNLITEEFKEKFKAAFSRFMNITIVASTLIAGFGLGYYFNELKNPSIKQKGRPKKS